MASATSTHNQLYSNENNNIPPVVKTEKELEAIGPRMGKRKMYKRDAIPNVNRNAPKRIIPIRLLRIENAPPTASPNSPVVNGNIMSSVGCKINKSPMVRT